jgi:hypothetical protein
MENTATRRGRFTPLKRKVIHEGRSFTLYSVGWLAILVNRHVQTVRNWEYKGYLPKPVFETDSTGVRYYNAAELMGYAEIINTFPRRCGAPGTLGATKWKDMGKRLHLFKNKLLSQLSIKDEQAFRAELPNEAKIYASWCNPMNKDLKQRAQRILADTRNN